jgi:type IV secretory pathway TrbL component
MQFSDLPPENQENITLHVLAVAVLFVGGFGLAVWFNNRSLVGTIGAVVLLLSGLWLWRRTLYMPENSYGMGMRYLAAWFVLILILIFGFGTIALVAWRQAGI